MSSPMPLRLSSPASRLALAGVSALALASPTLANGVFRDGNSARAMSLAGADVAWARDPVAALASNPAGLSSLTRPELQIGALAVRTEGSFQRPPDSNGSLDDRLRGAPDLAFALPLDRLPIVLGLSAGTDAAAIADWQYVDPAGGLGGTTSYGDREHRSELVLLRTALGAAIELHPRLRFGVSVGLLYNRNQLRSPFIFQSEPALQGAKTLLDLRTEGFGWDARAGLLFELTDSVQLGLAYRGQATVETDGTARGDAGVQLGLPSLPFRYDAEVETTFPHQVSAGLSWQAHRRWRLAGQVDWIGWADAFRTLEVRLTDGDNAALNEVVGSSSLTDRIPLNWKDRWVLRSGVEFAATDRLTLRAGYAWGDSPVPAATLTPMTAAIATHTLGVGAGFQWGRCTFDLAYQYSPPTRVDVGTSALRSGEYSGSSTEVSIHQLALSARIGF